MPTISKQLLRPDEQVVMESKATKFSVWFLSWGRLMLTDQRLLFLNRRGPSIAYSIDRNNISSVEKRNSFTLVHFIVLLILFALAALILFVVKTVRLTTLSGEALRYQPHKISERTGWLEALSAGPVSEKRTSA